MEICMKNKIALLLGSGLGSGYSPVAPGTAGSLLAMLLFYPIRSFFTEHFGLIGILIIMVTVIIGIWSANIIEKILGKKDPGLVVIDEVAGQWLTYLWVPFTWWGWIAGFFLFRLFDIVKPTPARQLENIKGGRGIMFDDLAAGVYANILLQIGVRLFI
jgi:phosphatidylglycerophosphatase A